MEQKHRKIIEKNTEKLIHLTDYNELMNACIKERLLTDIMRIIIEDIECENSTKDNLIYEKHKRLLLKITKRGPDAYNKLMEILRELDYKDAVNLLDVDDSQFVSIKKERERPYPQEPQLHNIKPQLPTEKKSKVANYDKVDTHNGMPDLKLHTNIVTPTKVLHVKISEKIMKDDIVTTYPMKTRNNRGVFFMVNIIDFPNSDEKRAGAEKDGELLLHIFHQLNFKSFAYNNLTQAQFLHLLEELIKSDYVKNAESFFMVLMTHGYMEKVQFHDGAIMDVEDIINHLNNINCRSLAGKPKILLLPFCRGDVADQGTTVSIYENEKSKVETDSIKFNQKTMMTLSDMLLCYACPPGYKAHRDKGEGSWYIQELCKQIAEYAHVRSFENILKLTANAISMLRTTAGEMQAGNYRNILFNKLYLNPGVYEEDGIVKRNNILTEAKNNDTAQNLTDLLMTHSISKND